MQRKKIFLIDISSFIFRAFFAIRLLTNSKGQPVNAVYGVMSMLLKLIEEHKPEAMVCVFDTSAPSFRKEIFHDYKANRGEPPEDLKPQFSLIEKAVDALAIKRIAISGFEADDIIATLVKKFKDFEVVIVTGDKDLMQLVNEHVFILDTMKDVLYTPEAVKNKMGVEPKQIPDLLGLMGDASDNIPGVKGVGAKTAVELIEKFGSIENLYENINELKEGKRKETILENKENAFLSKKLATVNSNLFELVQDIDFNSIKYNFKVDDKLISFLKEMEFKQLLKKIAPTIDDVQNQPLYNESKTVQEIEVRTVRDLEDLFTLLKEEQIAIDFDDKNVFLSTYKIKVKISFEENVKVHGGLEKKYFYDKFLDFLRDDLNRVLVGFDLKNLAKELLSIHIALEKIRHLFSSNCFDIMIAHYLVTSDSKNDFEFLVDRYLEANERYENRLIQILKIKEKLLKEIKKAELGHIFKTIEMPLIPVLAHMELHGVKIDVAYLKTLSKLHADELLEIEKKIYELSGTSFNINSPKQLAHILFEKLKLPPITKIKTGFSTDAEVLQKLAFTHELPALILRYRELTKLKSTYIDALPTLVDSHSRVHAHFNQAVTATGRLSSSNPNLQNIPIKTEDGKKIRKAFVADQGYLLVGADYSQIELRIVAHLSKDEVLIDSFLKGEDIHRRTAAEIFMVDPKDVTDSMRATAKAINFGLIYGKTAFGLSQELNISKAEAQKYIDTYFNRYKGVKAFMNHAIEEARRTGEVVTMFGRKRVIKDINSKNFALRSNAERMAINTPMQGTAADIIKLAMIRVLENISKFNSKIILSVHDEIVLEVPQDKAKEQEKALKEIMENIVKLDVPLVANTGIADNWMDL